MRTYTALDMIRFRKFAKGLKRPPIELLKEYDRLHPPLTAKEKLINVAIGLNQNSLHKALTGEDIPTPRFKPKKKGEYDVWDWVVDIKGRVIQIDHDDMPDLPYENIKRHATGKEITAAIKAKIKENRKAAKL